MKSGYRRCLLGNMPSKVSESELARVVKALTTSGKRRLKVVKTAFEAGLFENEPELFEPVLAALNDEYEELGDFVAEHVISLFGPTAFERVKQEFDLQGGRVNERRLNAMIAIDRNAACEVCWEVCRSGPSECQLKAMMFLDKADSAELRAWVFKRSQQLLARIESGKHDQAIYDELVDLLTMITGWTEEPACVLVREFARLAPVMQNSTIIFQTVRAAHSINDSATIECFRRNCGRFEGYGASAVLMLLDSRLNPEETFELFSPYFSDLNPDALTETPVDILGHLCRPIFVEDSDPNWTIDGVGRPLGGTPVPWSLRWLDISLKAKERETIFALARPGHEELKSWLESECTREPDPELVAKLFQCEHLKADSFFEALIQKNQGRAEEERWPDSYIADAIPEDRPDVWEKCEALALRHSANLADAFRARISELQYAASQST
ncbi:MAG: hypothetical protein ACI8UO_000860 [Verrucomicrobiales bacterium]